MAERLLWREIRGKRLGVEFHRQVLIDQFIVDFYCHEMMWAIEVDGITHDSEEAPVNDAQRQMKLEGFGISFLRVYDHEIRGNLLEVVREIASWVDGRRKNIPLKSPFKGGRLISRR